MSQQSLRQAMEYFASALGAPGTDDAAPLAVAAAALNVRKVARVYPQTHALDMLLAAVCAVEVAMREGDSLTLDAGTRMLRCAAHEMRRCTPEELLAPVGWAR